MVLAKTSELMGAATAAARGVAAFNVITLEHAEAIVQGADTAGSGVILQISQNAVAYHSGRVLPLARACLTLAQDAEVPVALHLDHAEDLALLRRAADAGFSSAMVDAGSLPYEQNVETTRTAAVWAHAHGLFLEAELGHVGGKPGAPAGAHVAGVRTDPEEAAAFVASTGVDALAVAVGSTHAMTTRSAGLDTALIAALRVAVPRPLVLHGSSGVPDEQLRAAVAAGIVKVNIGTALNVAMTAAVRAALADADSVDPRRYLGAARAAMATTVAALIEVVSTP